MAGESHSGFLIASGMNQFEFMLFTTDVVLARSALAAGVDAIVIDWECRDKERRQMGADTQINTDTPEDLARMRELAKAHVVVRINGFSSTTADEIETALGLGADELLLPMVRSVGEVERVLGMLRGRAPWAFLLKRSRPSQRRANSASCRCDGFTSGSMIWPSSAARAASLRRWWMVRSNECGRGYASPSASAALPCRSAAFQYRAGC